MSRTRNDEIAEYIRAHPLTLTPEEAANKFKVSKDVVYGLSNRRGIQALFKKGVYVLPYTPKEGTMEEEKLLRFLKSRKVLLTVEQIADGLDVSPKRVKEGMERLKKEGHNIQILAGGAELSREIPKGKPSKINVDHKRGTTFRFGVTGDNHLGSKYERLDVLNALYDIYEKEEIKDVYLAGNMIEGEARFNKFDIHTVGVDGQCEYFVKTYPKRKGITTRYITGDDHEGWYIQREGIDIGRYLEDVAKKAGRTDLVYLGHMEHDIVFPGTQRNCVMRIVHAGGGSSYATSYTAQKIVESYQGGEKPNILLIGHYHKSEYGYPREVHCVQVGCTQDQSPFMRKKKIQAHVGGWIIEFTVTKEGDVVRFKCEWIPFFDKGYYDRAWKYKK